MLITFLIQGSFHAYLKHASGSPEERQRSVSFIAALNKRLMPLPVLPDENTPDKR